MITIEDWSDYDVVHNQQHKKKENNKKEEI